MGGLLIVRLVDVLEGPLRKQLMSPVTVLLPEKPLASGSAQGQGVSV